MSKENAKKFLEELANNAAIQNPFIELTPSDIVSFAKKAEISFTKEEMKELLIEIGAAELQDEEPENASAEAL